MLDQVDASQRRAQVNPIKEWDHTLADEQIPQRRDVGDSTKKPQKDPNKSKKREMQHLE